MQVFSAKTPVKCLSVKVVRGKHTLLIALELLAACLMMWPISSALESCCLLLEYVPSLESSLDLSDVLSFSALSQNVFTTVVQDIMVQITQPFTDCNGRGHKHAAAFSPVDSI